MKGTLVKVYAALHPAGPEALRAVEAACAQAVGGRDWLSLEGDMLRISFEGLYFPLDDCLEALKRSLAPGVSGKLDYLDLEAWTLTRCTPEEGSFAVSTRNLNQVLEYSGH